MQALQRQGQRCRGTYSHASVSNGRIARVSRLQCRAQAEGKQVTVRMPTGIVFAQDNEGGPVYVQEVTPGGPADKSGVVRGDVLAACSAMVLKAGMEGRFQTEGHGEYLLDNWERVMFECKGHPFKEVMAALKSNNPRWGIKDVTLVFDAPNRGGAAVAQP